MTGGDEAIGLEAFLAVLAEAMSMPVERLGDGFGRLSELDLDELSLASLMVTVEAMNPFFALPDQVDIADVTLLDLHHFQAVMGAGHTEAQGATQHG